MKLAIIVMKQAGTEYTNVHVSLKRGIAMR